jgi:Tol biopolymer transport system component
MADQNWFIAFNPAWSPQEDQIVFSIATGSSQEIAIMNPDGSGFRFLTNNGESNIQPAWQPIIMPEPTPPSVTIIETNNTTLVTESSATDTYTLALGTQPTADVMVNIAGDAQISVSPTALTFTPENWDVPQTVTVAAADDSVIEGAHTAVITHGVISADAGYDGLAVADVTVTITDNDEPPVTPTPIPTPGAGWIVFSSNRDGVGQRSLYAARPDDTSAVRLTSDAGVIDRWPAWSPDRTLIAFTRTSSAGNEDIYIKRVTDNSPPVALGSLVNGATSNERQPVWSPDGTKLAYVSDRDGDKEIYVVTIDPDFSTSNRIKLTTNSAEDTSPDWYGNYIAFTSDSDGNFELYTIPVTGGNSIKLTNTGSVNGNVVKHSSPKWSPDGKYLAYTTNWQDGGDLDIYAFPMGSNGDKSGNRIPITTARSENDEFVAWEPQHTTSYRFAFVTDSGLGENFNDVYLMTVSEQSSGTPLMTTVSPAPVGWNSATAGENTPDW